VEGAHVLRSDRVASVERVGRDHREACRRYYATKTSKKWRLQRYMNIALKAEGVLRAAPKIRWPSPDDATVALLDLERALEGLR
jgi:hypothetical protein